MPKILANNINIYYELHGNNGDYLILIGGLTRDHTIWNLVIDQLSKEYRVVVFDNRGAGQSDKPDVPYSVQMLTEDLSALMDALNIKKANIVGHSMGGFMAITLAATHPDKVQKLIICSARDMQTKIGIAYLKNRIALVAKKLQTDPTMVSIATEDVVKSTLSWLYSKNYLSNPDNVTAIITREMSNPYPQPGYAFIRQAQACIDYDAHNLLDKIKVPTLVLCGSEDLIMAPDTSKDLASRINNATLKIFVGVSHMLQIEQPVEFAQTIINFLKDNTSLKTS